MFVSAVFFMMTKFDFAFLTESIASIIYPHCCSSCGSNNLDPPAGICAHCLHDLPETGFLSKAENPVANIFLGRLPVHHASAAVWFQKKSAVQQILHGIKYGGRKDAALQLGEWMGYRLLNSNWFGDTEILLPLPLHPKRFAVRGFNQAAVLCSGLARITGKSTHPRILVRKSATKTQTRQHRKERWDNMQGVFGIVDVELLINKHVVLIDDVVTTGATLEAMGRELLTIPGLQLSICCFAYTLPH